MRSACIQTLFDKLKVVNIGIQTLDKLSEVHVTFLDKNKDV